MTCSFQAARHAVALLCLAALPAGAAQLAGIVQDAAGRPVAGALVVARPASAPDDAAGTPRRWIATSDAAGRYAFDDLPEGACQVTANAGAARVGLASVACPASAASAVEAPVIVGAQAGHLVGVVHGSRNDVAAAGDVVLLARMSPPTDGATPVIAAPIEHGTWAVDLPAGTWGVKAVTAAGESIALPVVVPGQVKPVGLSVSPTHLAQPQVAAELRKLALQDQDVRNALLAGHKFDEAAMAPMVKVDAANLARLKAIVARHGWPDAAKVGNRGMRDFWLLAQHAPGDFIARALPHLKAAADRGEIAWASMALMIDRDLLDRDKPQIYGSQWNGSGASLAMAPTVDPAHVDERRAQVGLGPIADYKALIEKDYR